MQSWHIVYAHGSHIGLEMFYVLCYFSWLNGKTEVLKDTLREALHNRAEIRQEEWESQ